MGNRDCRKAKKKERKKQEFNLNHPVCYEMLTKAKKQESDKSARSRSTRHLKARVSTFYHSRVPR